MIPSRYAPFDGRQERHSLRHVAQRVEPYDTLVLSPGAGPIVPPWPGVDLPNIFSMRTVPDSQRLREALVGKVRLKECRADVSYI